MKITLQDGTEYNPQEWITVDQLYKPLKLADGTEVVLHEMKHEATLGYIRFVEPLLSRWSFSNTKRQVWLCEVYRLLCKRRDELYGVPFDPDNASDFEYRMYDSFQRQIDNIYKQIDRRRRNIMKRYG